MNETGYDGQGRKVEETIDHGDGTGTRTIYDPETGSVLFTESVDRPIPEAATLTDAERIADLEQTVTELLTIIAGE